MKTSKYFFLLLMFSFINVSILFSSSTGHLMGRVTFKEDSSALILGTIVFENNMGRYEAFTNEYGYYYASYLPTGRYKMSIEYRGHTFVMQRVKVYDSYTNHIDFVLSNVEGLPETVQLETPEENLNSLYTNDIVLSGNTFNQPTQTLGQLLSMQPGLDVVNGKLYIKGSDQVKYFIDGTPIMAQPNYEQIW